MFSGPPCIYTYFHIDILTSDLTISFIIHQNSYQIVFTKYFNEFIQKGVFPKILKTGRITPIFKKGDAQMFGNYRPVCTLSIFGKIFEKIILNRLQNFFSSNFLKASVIIRLQNFFSSNFLNL